MSCYYEPRSVVAALIVVETDTDGERIWWARNAAGDSLWCGAAPAGCEAWSDIEWERHAGERGVIVRDETRVEVRA